jgi:hypothetical protein
MLQFSDGFLPGTTLAAIRSLPSLVAMQIASSPSSTLQSAITNERRVYSMRYLTYSPELDSIKTAIVAYTQRHSHAPSEKTSSLAQPPPTPLNCHIRCRAIKKIIHNNNQLTPIQPARISHNPR